jgi:hypothetical protein
MNEEIRVPVEELRRFVEEVFERLGRAKRGCPNLCGCALGCGFAGNLFPWSKPPHPLCQSHSQWHSFPNNGAFCGP